MIEVGWGTVNRAVVRTAERRLRRSHRPRAALIQETTALGTSPDPALVARLLNQAGIDFVLIGAHALAVHTKEPRATADVDVVVSDVALAVKALRHIQPRTRILDLGDEVGRRIATTGGVELVDVLHPTGGVRGQLFQHRQAVTLDGEPAFVPTLTAMLALKWLAMFSPSRSALKQLQDKVDFLRIIAVHPKANIPAVARLVAKASPMLGAQLVYDMGEYRKTGDVRLFGSSDPNNDG